LPIVTDISTTAVTKKTTLANLGKGISHTVLGDIGTNTHAQIDTHVAATGTAVHGLGDMALQDNSTVNIDGGTIDGITDLAVADGGTGASTAADARTNLAAMGTAGGSFSGAITAPGVTNSGFFTFVRSSATIASGAITADSSFMAIDTEGGGAADNLDTINGQSAGRLLILQSTNSGRDITLTASGNLKVVGGTRVLNNIYDKIFMIADNTNWYELSFSDLGT
jgi:hypothetical protein